MTELADITERLVRTPTLAAWLAGAVVDHPLVHVDRLDAGAGELMAVFDALLAQVQGAAPLRWESKRRYFRTVRSEQALLALRAELVVAGTLIASGVTFEFGRPSAPNPDLVLVDEDLGVEITACSPAGIRELHDEVELALRDQPDVAVHLRFSRYPVRVKPEARALVLDTIMTSLAGRRDVTDAATEFRDDRNGGSIVVRAGITRGAGLPAGFRVSWETTGGLLQVPLDAVENTVFQLLRDRRKQRQSLQRPTVLVVDITRLGASWLRPMEVWAGRLADRLASDAPFAAVAVMLTSLETNVPRLALAVAPSSSRSDRARLEHVAGCLGAIQSARA